MVGVALIALGGMGAAGLGPLAIGDSYYQPPPNPQPKKLMQENRPPISVPRGRRTYANGIYYAGSKARVVGADSPLEDEAISVWRKNYDE